MPQFRYTVVNKENKQLAGVIDAPDIETARTDLQELGFSIVSLEKKEKEEKEPGFVFEFKGIDTHNKNISGTIRSESRYNAFKRLITEYDLDVNYLVRLDLSAAEKAKQKKQGVVDLMKKYQEEVKKKTDLFHEKKIKTIDRNFEKNKALVMRQVDYVLKKVNEFIDKFRNEINPQDKQNITNLVNKILRIKTSTNLDYIKKTCIALLEYLQNAEIFIHKRRQIEDKVKLYAESQGMIEVLEKGKIFGEYEDLEDKLLRWQKENIKGKKKIPLKDRILNLIYTFIIRIIHEDREIRKVKQEISFINKDIKQYINIYIKAKDPSYRKEASNSIKKLRIKKKTLKNRLDVLRKNYKKQLKAEGEKNLFEMSIDLINGVTAWLLFFYLVYYFASSIIISKEILFAKDQIPSIFYLFQTGALKYILPIVFLLHITTSMKLTFFRKNIYSNLFLFPGFFLAALLIVFNF